jgi:alcohol dehydrogenase (cytochrome c)
LKVVLAALPFLVLLAVTADGQAPEAGRALFENRCSGCHGADGNGGELGPPIARRLTNLNDDQIKTAVTQGIPSRGMPANAIGAADMPRLIAFLRTLRPRRFGFQPYRTKIVLTNGGTLEGIIVAEGFADAQLRTDDSKLHMLRRAGSEFREVTSEVNWPTYNGDPGGNRFTTLAQIDRSNVNRVAPRWIFPMPNASGLEATPVVADGVMYVTSANECYALDAGSGRQIWHFQRPRTRGLIGNAAGGINRGVALAGDKIYMVTDNAHLLALNRGDGEVAWEIEIELQRDLGAAGGGEPRDYGHGGRRRRSSRLRGGVRSGDRQGGVAVLDGARAGRAGVGDVAG